MTELYQMYVPPIILLAALAVWQWSRVRRRDNEIEQLKKSCKAATESCKAATESWQKSVEQTREAAGLAGEQKTRADSYHRVITQIGVERDRWNAAYHDASSGHRTAQQMLMDELSRLSKILSRGAQICTDKPGKAHESLPASKIQMLRLLCSNHVDPQIATIVQEYAEQHGEAGMAAGIEHASSEVPAEGAQPAV